MSSEESRSRAVRQCVNSSCELRYVAVGPTTKSKCERCGSTTQVMGRPTATGAVPVGEPVEPWYYGAARLCASIAVAAAIVSVIVGIAVGVEASKYETSYGETGHHQGVLVLSILSGVLGAVLWVAVAAALLLLVEIGESLRRKAA